MFKTFLYKTLTTNTDKSSSPLFVLHTWANRLTSEILFGHSPQHNHHQQTTIQLKTHI